MSADAAVVLGGVMVASTDSWWPCPPQVLFALSTVGRGTVAFSPGGCRQLLADDGAGRVGLTTVRSRLLCVGAAWGLEPCPPPGVGKTADRGSGPAPGAPRGEAAPGAGWGSTSWLPTVTEPRSVPAPVIGLPGAGGSTLAVATAEPMGG
ncbi:hypothetical protein LWC34_38765 [Kibdelosporangium philippinense]|uniref:Uncharacterized protein n=1 Tax=Kibdelosporangium philippinense TaxID=211113 RepID=A0ABS8ZSB7_9PSEU|nr:hypothetical protein [Kibdelosporangium philippinense]MCE7008712.1 hypothetical protein [Kibdelosporangium philippinense]